MAAVESEVVGMIIGKKLKARSWLQTKAGAQIDNLIVKEKYRNQGVGKKLFESFKKWAKALGVERIELDTRYSNESAIQFYEKQGFKTYTQRMEMTI